MSRSTAKLKPTPCVVCGGRDAGCFGGEFKIICRGTPRSATPNTPHGWEAHGWADNAPGGAGHVFTLANPLGRRPAIAPRVVEHNEPDPEFDVRDDVAADAPACTEPTPEPLIVTAADVETVPVCWLWQDRLELGALNLLAADPGSGKSLLTAVIASTVTRGTPWPDNRREPIRAGADVLFVCSEDDPRKATVPRLRAAEADLRRVHLLQGVRVPGDDATTRPFSLAHDLDLIRAALDRFPDIALVIIDPIDSYIGNIDSNHNEAVRAVLEPVVRLAEERDIAVLAVKHLNKAQATTATALYRIGGSVAYGALPRTVSIIADDADEPGRRLFMPLKVSHGPKPEALAYRVQRIDGQPVLTWEAQSAGNVDANEVLQRRKRPDTATDRAVEWLQAALRDGPMPSRELNDKAKAEGVTGDCLNEARRRLGVEAYQERSSGGRKVAQWLVRLP